MTPVLRPAASSAEMVSGAKSADIALAAAGIARRAGEKAPASAVCAVCAVCAARAYCVLVNGHKGRCRSKA